MLKNICIIPARGGSKRLPNKNLMLLDGVPLIEHSINYAKNNLDIIYDIFVSTDCSKIKNISLDLGVKVIDRPKKISGDLEPTVTALKHVVQSIDYKVDNIILFQATNPLRSINLLKDVYQKYLENSLGSIFTVSRNYDKLGKIINERFIPFNYEVGQRSQDLEPLYYENGLLYIVKKELILDEIIITKDSYPFLIEHPYASVDIDTQDDFDYAEYVLNKYKRQ